MHYKTSPSATISTSTSTTVRIDDIIDVVRRGTSKLDVLKTIYTVAWNKIMHDLKTDTTVTAAYPKDDKGDVLHQILEETAYGVTLKGYAVKGGRFTLDKTLAQMMDVMNVAGTGLGDGVRLVFRNNGNIKRIDTFTYNNDEINLFSGVDWVFTTLQTPWSSRYIPETVYQHVDINCDMIIPQQANNNKSKYVLHHAEVGCHRPDMSNRRSFCDGGTTWYVSPRTVKMISTFYHQHRRSVLLSTGGPAAVPFPIV